METFGMFAFVIVFFLWGKVSRLERTLRENNIRPGGTGSLGSQLRAKVGQRVMITLYEGGGTTITDCKVLDADEEWAHVLRNEGKRNQRELLLRLSDVKQVRG
jgi:molybdenum-dependent DNA-binding transcriptional regulator ModE